MHSTDKLMDIASRFNLEGEVQQVAPLGEGFINDTFTVTTRGDASNYILQRKNRNVFPNVPAMMSNIERVTAHLRRKVAAAGGDVTREVLTVVRTRDNVPYWQDEQGEYWAVTRFISGSVTHDRANTPRLAYKGGQGIGRFQSQLADFTGHLTPVIEGFHDMNYRMKQWREALRTDAKGRAESVREEISWIESRRKHMLAFQQMVDNGTLPQRVTHNDTKISNILFDRDDNVLCVIDLDTVMSSTSLNDYGDAIRSYTNTGAEDDRDLSRVGMSMEMMEAYTRGYLDERRSTLQPVEKEWLAFSALFITYEQVLRFLMDYIDGDTYYKIAYPEHNLVRARAQHRLLVSMEDQYPQMLEVVRHWS